MKKVLLDCGANKGQSYDVFFKNRDDADQYEIHCFEPSPTFSSYLSEKSATYHQEAVWIEDGTMDFYDKGNSLSGTIYKNKVDNKGGGEKIQVDCIDFSKFIIDNFNKDDYIIVKFDIEGAEYKVIEKMLEDKTFEYVDEFFIEFHGAKIQDLHPYFDEVYEREGVDAKTYLLEEINKYDLKNVFVYGIGKREWFK
tara:strand:+ start:714 stop:1301 length:588 start_codon:yes stop_codon:yes gene_type:complete